MIAKARMPAVFLFALAVAMILPMSADAKKSAGMYRVSHFGRVVVGKPIDIGLDHKGVKLETITFSGDEATIILWNRTPNAVKAHVGVALFDKKNRLIAAESDATSMARSIVSIRSGKQANLKVKFKKFLSSLDGAAKYQVVLVTQM